MNKDKADKKSLKRPYYMIEHEVLTEMLAHSVLRGARIGFLLGSVLTGLVLGAIIYIRSGQ